MYLGVYIWGFILSDILFVLSLVFSKGNVRFLGISPAVLQSQGWFLARAHEKANYCFLSGDAWLI